MATNVTVIGRATRIRGRVTGGGDLEIQGFVDGEVAVGGDVTVAAPGIVGANVRGRRLLVRGVVKGDLVGDESVFLEQSARVVGDVRAPRVAIAPGALVRGHVQTGDVDGPAARGARPQAAARPGPAVMTAVAAAAPKAVVTAPPKIAAKAPPTPIRVAPPPAPAVSGPRRPPPPVVPALRSGKGQIAKKRER
jgi:cytoskeletal protein CcmA (bactofilin family)